MNLLTEHIHEFAKKNQMRLLVLLMEYEDVTDPEEIFQLLNDLPIRKN